MKKVLPDLTTRGGSGCAPQDELRRMTSRAECSLIVEQALAILEETGMHFGQCAPLDELERAGARVDREAGVARLPAASSSAPSRSCRASVLLAGAHARRRLSARSRARSTSRPRAVPTSRSTSRPASTGRARSRTCVARRSSPTPWSRSTSSGRWSAPPTSSPGASLFRELVTMAARGAPSTSRTSAPPLEGRADAGALRDALRQPRRLPRAAAHQLRLLHHVAARPSAATCSTPRSASPAPVARSSSTRCRSPARRRR